MIDDLLEESETADQAPAGDQTPGAGQKPVADDERDEGDKRDEGDDGEDAAPVTVFGDSAYADGATLDKLAEAGHEVFAKVPPVRNAKGYSKDEFRIDTEAGTVGCPAGHTAPIRPGRGGVARFTPWCGDCPLRAACTTARAGRVITIHPHEARLQQAKARQRDPGWQQAYRATRPTVERKIAHFTRRAWGGRKARTRGKARILTDVIARAGAINLARLARLGLHYRPGGWAIV